MNIMTYGNMKFYSIFALTVIACANCEDVYKTKFDNVDVESIMKNERLLKNHLKCLLEDKACIPELEELKKHIPEMMETCCAKCSEKHKENGRKVALYMMEHKPDIVKKVMDKYDPQREYVKRCSEQLTASGIDITKL
ncbi:hypothetical protein WA026_018050 [Henosepilachna vigintioctopunctata]|uniref:Chemosensory protein n=1 Tax=Henosepilachna vigintioctopunctata TaxID=420089 RepID=A0AAW1UPG0_9CUCU